MKNKVSILGTGAYGIALAKMFHLNECDILMWTKFEDEKKLLETTRMNDKVLPNIKLEDDIRITTDVNETCLHADILVIAIPAAFVYDTMMVMKDYLKKDTIICIASKGIDEKSGLFMSQILENFVERNRIIVLSGPSFAIDVVSGQPTGLTIAGTNDDNINKVTNALSNNCLRLVPSDDILGVEICGSIKNVIAIASGMLDGFNANPSCNAMFLTEAMHDIKNLIKQLGGNDRTILSYAGFGDILLTCTSSKSRNFTFGYNLVTKSEEEVAKYREETTIEGLYTLSAIKKLIAKKNINVPIIEVIDNIVNQQKNPKILLEYLIKKEIIQHRKASLWRWIQEKKF